MIDNRSQDLPSSTTLRPSNSSHLSKRRLKRKAKETSGRHKESKLGRWTTGSAQSKLPLSASRWWSTSQTKIDSWLKWNARTRGLPASTLTSVRTQTSQITITSFSQTQLDDLFEDITCVAISKKFVIIILFYIYQYVCSEIKATTLVRINITVRGIRHQTSYQ